MHPKTEVRLYLIRHGESHMNLNPSLIGGRSANTPLSQHGEDQATALYKHFRKNKVLFDQIHCSPFERTKMTASIVLGQDAPVVIIDDRLVEYSAGEWEGKERDEVQTPDALHKMSEMGIDFRPPNGESQRDVILRVAAWLQEAILGNDEILQSGRCINVVVFSHGLAIKCLLHHILDFNSHLIWRMEIDNCGVSKLVFNARGWWPKYINRILY